MELAKRDTFLIDPQGKVVKHYSDVDPKADSKNVLADIQALSKKKS
jgi:peroxiredoxin Q/BCP